MSLSPEWDAWLDKSGIRLNCEISATPTAGNGLFPYKLTETFVVVPKDLVITHDRILELGKLTPFLQKLLCKDSKGRDIEAPSLAPRQSLSRFLLYLILTVRRGSPDPLFGEWVRNLPPSKAMHLPFTWPDAELDSLETTSLYDAVHTKRGALKLAYMDFFTTEDTTIRQEVAEFVKSGPGPIKDALDLEITFHDWQLVEEWILSRSLSIPKDGGSEIAMIPVIDFANHSTNANARYEFDDEGNAALVLVGDKMLFPGTEITICYGDTKSSSEFLFTYGFIPSDHETTQSLTRFYDMMDPAVRTVLDPDHDPEAENNTELDIGYDLLAAFLERPQNAITLVAEPRPAWHDDFIYLLACEDSLKLVKDEASGYYELQFFGTELDLNDVEGFLREKNPTYFREVIQGRANSIARAYLRFVLREMDGDDDSNAAPADKKPQLEHHRLWTLERALVQTVLDNTESTVTSPLALAE